MTRRALGLVGFLIVGSGALGSAQNDECQIDAIPQAWAVISGAADPARAKQAMAAVESDQEPNTVVAVLQKGYTLHDRVVRPALVSVAKAKAVEKGAGNPTSDSNLASN